VVGGNGIKARLETLRKPELTAGLQVPVGSARVTWLHNGSIDCNDLDTGQQIYFLKITHSFLLDAQQEMATCESIRGRARCTHTAHIESPFEI
jgi:hypothetical protein